MSTNIKTLVVYLDAYVTLAFNCQRTLETLRFPRAHAALPGWAQNFCVRKLLASVAVSVLVEMNGIEPSTSGLQSPRSPN